MSPSSTSSGSSSRRAPARARRCPRAARAGSAGSRGGGRPRPRRGVRKTSPRLDVLDAPLRDAHAAPLGVLAHAHVVALRAREVLQQVAVALGRHDAQVELHAVVGRRPRPSCAVAEHLGDERLLDEPRRQRRPVGRGGDHVDVAHRLGAPPQRAGLVGALAGRMRAQRLRAPCARARAPGRAGTRACAARRPPRAGRAAAAPCARRSRPGPAGVPVARGGLELGERRDAELLARAGGRSSRRARAGARSRRGSRARARAASRAPPCVPVSRSSSTFVAIVSPMSSSSVSRPCSDSAPDRLGGLAEALGGPAVGEHAVDDGAVQLVEVAEQVEQIGDLAIAQGHARIVAAAAWHQFAARMPGVPPGS